MSADRVRPELSIVDGYDKKFRRYDFNRFDDLASQHASLGDASLGKIHVDCRFMFQKSKWGTFEGHKSAGIVYLDLAFSQPSDCRLKHATVQVTLDDDDENLIRQFPSRSPRRPVHIVKYGPRHMTGAPVYEQISTHNRFIPSVELGPLGGAGGIGRESEKVTVRECRWMFESHLKPGRRKGGNDNWAYKVLQLQITENELETQSLHSNTVHAAFAFVHGGQPLFMRVEVSGKLESRTADLGHQIRNMARRLRFPANPNRARYATTFIEFKGHERFTTPLDGLVGGLELAMEHENMTPPVEVQRPQQPRFFEARPPETPVPPPPSIAQHTNPQGLLGEQEDPTAPTVEDIASLSARWLMAPPITPLAPAWAPGAHNNEPRRPVGVVPSQPASPQHQGENLSAAEVNIDEQVQHIPSRQAGRAGQELRDISEAIGRNGLQRQAAADPVDLGTVMFLMRIWMLQTIATLLGYKGDRSDPPPRLG